MPRGITKLPNLIVITFVDKKKVIIETMDFQEREEQYESALDAAEEILEQAKEAAETSSRLQQQQLDEETCQAAMEAKRVRKKELLTSKCYGLPGSGQHVVGGQYSIG